MLDKITEIQKLKLNENEVLIVKLPLGVLPMGVWKKQAADIGDILKTYLLTNNVLVVGDDINFTVINKEKNEFDYSEHF